MSRLLVVEDSPINREALCSALTEQGFDVVPAADGDEALRRLDETHCDLVLLDVMLPGRSGLEVLDTVRGGHSALELPVIMVTARSESSAVVAALERGANDFVAKPIDVAVLLARVRTHLELKRLAARHDEFLRMASHDLRKPLEVILDMAASLVERRPADDKLDEILGQLLRTGCYMSEVLDAFLDLETLEAGRVDLALRPVDLNDLVRRVRERHDVAARAKDAGIVVEAADLPAVRGDAVRLEQVIDNLVGNALKFSPPGSRTVIRTAAVDGGVLVEVIDAGPGLRDDDFPKAFRKFARLSSRPTAGESSTGLGLAICRKIVEMHGGVIGVRNNPDRGATFWFRLPAS